MPSAGGNRSTSTHAPSIESGNSTALTTQGRALGFPSCTPVPSPFSAMNATPAPAQTIGCELPEGNQRLSPDRPEVRQLDRSTSANHERHGQRCVQAARWLGLCDVSDGTLVAPSLRADVNRQYGFHAQAGWRGYRGGRQVWLLWHRTTWSQRP